MFSLLFSFLPQSFSSKFLVASLASFPIIQHPPQCSSCDAILVFPDDVHKPSRPPLRYHCGEGLSLIEVLVCDLLGPVYSECLSAQA